MGKTSVDTLISPHYLCKNILGTNDYFDYLAMNNTKKKVQDELIFRAKKMLHYNNLLIDQCDSWLSEEEGVINVEKRIKERIKKKKWIQRVIKTN